MACRAPGFCAGTAVSLRKVPLMDPRRTRAREACLCACRTVGPPARATSGNMSRSMSECSHPNRGCKCAARRGSGRALPSSARHIHVARPSYNTHDRRSKAPRQGLTWWFCGASSRSYGPPAGSGVSRRKLVLPRKHFRRRFFNCCELRKIFKKWSVNFSQGWQIPQG